MPLGQTIHLQTSRQNDIINHQGLELSQTMYNVVSDFMNLFPTITIRTTNVCPLYNCHGMTFAGRRTAIEQDDEIYKILHDDSYHLIPESEVLPGDIAIYIAKDGSIDHSGIVVTKREGFALFPTIYSKWGAGLEAIHEANVCPYDVGQIKYYRQRYLVSGQKIQKVFGTPVITYSRSS